MYMAKTGKYELFSLPGRYNDMALPDVRIVDMKRELRSGLSGSISGELRRELAENIEKGRQSILFINRRGASKLITCVDCGYTYRCHRCSVNLTYHSHGNRLICHQCGYGRPPDGRCPECGGALSFTGDGTQRVQEELAELFPGVEILRMDTDTVTPLGSHDRLLSRFRDENIPIMVGTQMVTKGLNFENVTLVGVLSADQSLYTGNYRSSERTFSLITQVVGRSGRGAVSGRASIQTFTPENDVILHAAKQDYEGFYSCEIELRRLQGSPPFSEMYALTLSGMDEQQVIKACIYGKELLSKLLEGERGLSVLGPAPLNIVKISGRFRYRVTICCENGKNTRRALSGAVTQICGEKRFRGVSAFAEKDPND
jgi:primosomal protein N' (replication factor Y)